MARITIPITATLKRTDNSAMQPSDLALMTAFLSLDGGANFSALPTLAPDATQIVIDGMDPGTQGIVEATETDKQTPPATSAMSARVTFSVPVPRLADPQPPTLGTPVVA